MKFQVGEIVVDLRGGWYTGRKARVTRINGEDWMQVRYLDISDEDYRSPDNGHSAPPWYFRKLTKLEKELK